MGAEARWVCNTCKTVCDPGGRPVIVRTKGFTMEDWKHTRETLSRLESLMLDLDVHDSDMPSLFTRWDHFLSDLAKWLSRHDGHGVHIGSDYTTDMADLDDYYNETVDGKKSDATRLEIASRSADEWRNAGIDKIKTIITAYKSKGAHGVLIDVDEAAEALYNQFCIDMAVERGG